ncbi:AraC family transcriptional regulator [Mucilaginibacter sp. 21P]|uniref:helix-turn-helix domain-containing protein n=1 Tax=Mucilaginibacter sp. 21P TaxID=2778902 RepID=UPI001C5648B0|nr:helix-turn-helix domain-containing protein [Mucilaginibacter sp. 21P]QXV63730.1 AraC family transcriptional regulator [Mucilaginibacter sp. 21P]
MPTKSNHIPTYTLPPGTGSGIMIMRNSFDGSMDIDHVDRPHRDGGYTFILQEKGIMHIEIDFQSHRVESPAVIFIRQGQVHRVIGFEHATISTWMVTEENLRPEYLNLLNNLAPVNALTLSEQGRATLTAIAAMCLRIFEGKEEKLHHTILQDACNTLVGVTASQYVAHTLAKPNHNRFEVVTNAFRQTLEQRFKSVKRPADYAAMLNLSIAYLNECVKSSSGRTVTNHIHERVVLEAKRLLCHSDKSVKEIAAELGYDDYSYFTRLFVKIAGMTPLTFRNHHRV